MKDDYKRLSNEWGSKARKEEARSRKTRLRADTRERAKEGEVEVLEKKLEEIKARQVVVEKHLAENPPPPSSGNEVAPKGQVWECQACGKRSRDLYGDQRISYGWDESCTLNAALVDE